MPEPPPPPPVLPEPPPPPVFVPKPQAGGAVTIEWQEFRRLVAGDPVVVETGYGYVIEVKLGDYGLDLMQMALDDSAQEAADEFAADDFV